MEDHSRKDSRISDDLYGLRPVIDYEYEVDGRPYQGAATGCSFRDGMMELGDRVDSLVANNPGVQIRYDPDNPARNYFLNDDNPHFLFQIDHDLLGRPAKK